MGKKKYDGTTSLRNDGRWMGKLWLDDGTRKSVYGKTKEEVEAKLRKVARDQEKGLPIVSDKRTVGEYLTEWLETVRPRLQPTTHTRYEQLMRLQVTPELGKVKLSKLTPHQVQKLYATWRERGLSATSVKHLHTVLHGALAQAVKWDYLARNPTDLVVKPKMGTREMKTLTREQVDRFLEVAKGDRLEALYLLAVSTGMRQGELLALRWTNVDLERGTLQVRGTMQPTPDGLRISQPKTKASKRRLQLAPLATDALRKHKSEQNGERLKLGPAWADLDLVFPNRVGQPMRAGDLLKRSFHPLLRQAGLPRMRFHEIRHSAASLHLEAGTPVKVVSEMLGHGSIGITLDTYAHVMPSMQDRAAEVANDILSGAGSRSARSG